MFKRSDNDEKNVITAIAIKSPGMAYPEIDRFEIKFKKLFFKILFPKLQKKAKEISMRDVTNIKRNVL